MTDLITHAVGGRIVSFNDEFFGGAENLLRPTDPEWKEGVYTDRGKWMDGWETRRRREPGHDWCVVALGIPGVVNSVVVDTSHFTGNFPEAFSLEACGVGSDQRLAAAEWVEIVPLTPLAGDTVAGFEIDDPHRVTHLRLNIHPDGGVARLRVDGNPIPSMDQVCPDGHLTDLVSSVVGGRAVDASDSHYSPPSNMLRPSDPSGMWDGWETRRRRGPGNDWATFELGLPGIVRSVEIDTRHFKGNAPGWVSVQLSGDGDTWDEAVTRAGIRPDLVNEVALEPSARAKFLRLDIFPDGGVARLRVRGSPDTEAASALRLRYLNSLFEPEARRFFDTACTAGRWVDVMLRQRPYQDADGVLTAADAAFDGLAQDDWLEAFAGHPRIGERGDEMANREQSAAATARDAILVALAEANRAYETSFGFTYIVYATGKGAEEMLQIARARLSNTWEQEMLNASQEQRKITRTRLRRMLCMGGGE